MGTIKIKVIPRAHKNEIVSFEEGTLTVRVRAVPERGKANEAVLLLLAQVLNVAPSTLSIRKGKGSRIKELEVEEYNTAQLHELLGRI